VTVNLRVRFTFNNAGHSGLLTTYWRPGTGGGSNADATDMLARVRAALFGCRANYGVNCTYTPVLTCDAIEDTTGALTGSFTGTTPLAIAGTAAGDVMPFNNAFLVKWLTSSVVNGRKLQGRTFMAGCTEAQNNASGVPNGADITAIAAAFLGTLTGGATASFPVVWNRPRAADPDHGITARVGDSRAVTSVTCDGLKFGSQRMRRFH